MAQLEIINVGATANDGTGDPLRVAFEKVNNNFTNLWSTGFNSLPTSVRTRISAGNVTPYTRRNAAIDAIGTVVRLISVGQSRFYIIRRPSGRVIGFATMQPDAKHFVVTGNTFYRVPRVSALANVLQAQGLNEATKTLIKLHAVAMPEEINKMKELLKSLKNKKK